MSLTAGSRAILAAAATLIVVAGCAGAGASASPAASASPSPSAASSAEASGQAAGPPEVYEVTVATDAMYGAHLAGEDGKSLYIFGKDSANTSACSGTCTANWPPFLLGAGDTVKAGTGVTGTLATFKRADGSTQVTINGLPLYYFANDSAAGAVNGQGVGGLWHLASPTGTPVGASPNPSAGYGY